MKVTPMLNVSDVQSTVDWYRTAGFVLESSHGKPDLDWAMMSFGTTSIMFNAGGNVVRDRRRDVYLYVYDRDLAERFDQVSQIADVAEPIHVAFHGREEFIVRDPNGFWITFSVEGDT